MSQKVIGFDVDGVLANFFDAYERVIIEVSGEDRFGEDRYPNQLPQSWNWPQESFGYSSEVINEVWRKIKNDAEFWWMLDPLPGVDDFLTSFSILAEAKGWELYFITDRPGIDAQAQTADWLWRYGVDQNHVIISRKGKGAVCSALSIDYYIDDKPENIVDVWEKSPETELFLLDYPYNQDGQGNAVFTRVHSLNQFLGVINQ